MKSRSAAAVVLLLGIFVIRAVTSLGQESLTHDEGAHIAAGFSYWKTGDFRMNYEHPPLVKLLSGLPLFLLAPDFPRDHPSWAAEDEWAFADRFVYHNRVRAEEIAFLARLPVVALACVLGILVFRWSRRLYGTWAGLFALFLYTFCPNILAHSRLVTTDLGISLFLLWAVGAFARFLEERSARSVAQSGMSLGLALATKFSAVLLGPIWVGLVLAREGRNSFRWLAANGRALIQMTALGALVVLASYHLTEIPNWVRGFLRVGEESSRGHMSFLCGRYSVSGWRSYFVVAFLLKTPLALLALMVARSLVKARTAPTEGESARRLAHSIVLAIPVIVVFLSGTLAHKQVGLRHILPAYPFLFIWVSGIASPEMWPARPRFRRAYGGFVAVACLWYGYASLGIHPHYLAYFNELAGGPRNGYEYLVDSNLDWGQDLEGLRRLWEKEGKPEIVLSYFGTANPAYYGIAYQDLFTTKTFQELPRHINSLSPEKEWLAVSASNLQGLYFGDPTLFDWLRAREARQIGYSIFVYDTTADVETHLRLGLIYARTGRMDECERELRRAESIDGGFRLKAVAEAYDGLGIHHARLGHLDLAERYVSRALEHDPDSSVARQDRETIRAKRRLVDAAKSD